MLKKTTFYILLICFPLFSYSQNWIEKAKSKVWISSTNDKLQINDSNISILGYKIDYHVSNGKIILQGKDRISDNVSNESMTIILGEDSLIVQVQNLSSLMEKYMFKADYNALKNNISRFQNHIKDNFNGRLTFYDSTQLYRFKKDLFVKINISRYPTKLSIDSVGNVSIISSDYSSFFMVNNGNYIGKLDSTKFINLKEYLFDRKFYSIKHWGFYEKDFTTRTDSRPIDLSIKSKMNDIRHEYYGEKEIYRELISLIISDNYPNDINLKLKEKDTLLSHEVIKIEREILEKGVESVTGRLEFIDKVDGVFLYSLLVDSVYSQRNFVSRIENRKKIYCVSNKNLKAFDMKKIGLTIIRKIAYHTSPFIKDKKLSYYEIVSDFSANNSTFFEYFGLYYPRGFTRGIGRYLPVRRIKRTKLFKIRIEKFSKPEKRISKIKNVAQQ